MMRQVSILYEDSVANGNVKNYGPHVFVQQCVGDRLGKKRWELKTLEAMPKNGVSNVRVECRRIPPKIARDGRLVVAVYDADKIRREVELPITACKVEVKKVLKNECSWQDRLCIVLLDRNIETVVEAVRACEPTLVPDEIWEQAIKRKNLNERDIILTHAASPPKEALREQVLVKVPSLAYLVHKLVVALSAPDVAGG